VPQVELLVPLAGGFEVGGGRVPVATLEDLSHQCRAETAGLPPRSRAEEEQVGVGLLGVVLVHQLERGEEPFGGLLGSVDPPGHEPLRVFAAGLTTGWDPDRGGGRDRGGRVELVVRVIDIDGDLEEGAKDLGASGGVRNPPHHHRIVDEGGGERLDDGGKVVSGCLADPQARLEGVRV
jgi:hypothetical protein